MDTSGQIHASFALPAKKETPESTVWV